MPPRAKHPCRQPGCGLLVAGGVGRCEEHEAWRADEYRRDDERRGQAQTRGYDARHKAWRKRVLERDPTCACGCGRRAVVADHVVPLKHGKRAGWTDERLWSLANGQGLAWPCHERKKWQERRACSCRACLGSCDPTPGPLTAPPVRFSPPRNWVRDEG